MPRVLLRELDFRVEAQYAARFRQQFLDDDRIRIPGVVWELSSRRVLCLDYLPGIKVNDRAALIEAGSTLQPLLKSVPPATSSSRCASGFSTPTLTRATWRWPPMGRSSTTTSG